MVAENRRHDHAYCPYREAVEVNGLRVLMLMVGTAALAVVITLIALALVWGAQTLPAATSR